MSQESEDGSNSHRLSVDSVLELLSQYQRREILRVCRDSPTNNLPMHKVIHHLRDVESRRTGEKPGIDHLQAVLIHVHGPKLSANGLIEYDVEDQYIRYFPNEQVESALEHIDRMEDEW